MLLPLVGKHGTGKYALIDDEDYELVKNYRWYLSNRGYVISPRSWWCPVKKKRILKITKLHRLICPYYKMIDHINHDKSDNQKTNLRDCTNSQNQINSVKQIGCTSKYKGVRFHRGRLKWYACITHNQRTIHLGSFDNEVSAAIAYDKKAKELFGEFVNLNLS